MKTAIEHARKWLTGEQFEVFGPVLINPEKEYATPHEALMENIPFDMRTMETALVIIQIKREYLRQLVLQARRLSEQIDALNPNCLSLGAGMMSRLKELSKEILSL